MDTAKISSYFSMPGNYNPGIFSKQYFTSFNAELSDLNQVVFNSEFAVLDSGRIQIQVKPDDISVYEKPGQEDKVDKIQLSRLFKQLIGQNNLDVYQFIYNATWIVGIRGSARNQTKKLFYPRSNPIIEDFFNNDDSSYGYFIIQKFQDFKLRLDIKPGVIQNMENLQETQSVLELAFSFMAAKPDFRNTDINECDVFIKQITQAFKDLVMT